MGIYQILQYLKRLFRSSHSVQSKHSSLCLRKTGDIPKRKTCLQVLIGDDQFSVIKYYFTCFTRIIIVLCVCV